MPRTGIASHAEQVFYGHVLGFKGLERRAVVLVFNEQAAFERSRERLYVGLSRARDQLIVCGDPLSSLKWAVQNWRVDSESEPASQAGCPGSDISRITMVRIVSANERARRILRTRSPQAVDGGTGENAGDWDSS